MAGRVCGNLNEFESEPVQVAHVKTNRCIRVIC
jgi:hypothetical protein